MDNIRGMIQKHRRPLSFLCTALAAVLILWTVNNPAIVGASATERQLPIYCVQRDDKKIAISFDAAWGNEDTQKLIDILSAYGVRSTFFVVGDWAEKYPESVKSLHEAGHEVMSHSSHHDHFSMMSAEQIAADLREANRKISASTGVEPSLFRCPYGEYDDHVIQTVKRLGMTAIQWSVDSLDWKGIDADGSTMQPNIRPRLCPAYSRSFSGRVIPSFRYPSCCLRETRGSTTPADSFRPKAFKKTGTVLIRGAEGLCLFFMFAYTAETVSCVSAFSDSRIGTGFGRTRWPL